MSGMELYAYTCLKENLTSFLSRLINKELVLMQKYINSNNLRVIDLYVLKKKKSSLFRFSI